MSRFAGDLGDAPGGELAALSLCQALLQERPELFQGPLFGTRVGEQPLDGAVLDGLALQRCRGLQRLVLLLAWVPLNSALAASFFSCYTVATKPLIERHGGVVVMTDSVLLGSVPLMYLMPPVAGLAAWGGRATRCAKLRHRWIEDTFGRAPSRRRGAAAQGRRPKGACPYHRNSHLAFTR